MEYLVSQRDPSLNTQNEFADSVQNKLNAQTRQFKGNAVCHLM